MTIEWKANHVDGGAVAMVNNRIAGEVVWYDDPKHTAATGRLRHRRPHPRLVRHRAGETGGLA